MAKRMDGTETWFRVRIDVAYTIRYRSYNPDWDYQRPTTGEIEGSNPTFVQHPEDTREDFYTYLGPYNSLKQLEREYEKFVEHYEGSPDSYRDLVMERGHTQTAEWVDIDASA